MSFINQSLINIIQLNQPLGLAGPNVNTTLTNKSLSGSAFTEREFLKALEIRRSLPRRTTPQRELTDLEKAEVRLINAKKAIRNLPSVFYNKNINADMAQDELRGAIESLNDLHSAKVKRNAIDEAKARIRAAMDARKKH